MRYLVLLLFTLVVGTSSKPRRDSDGILRTFVALAIRPFYPPNPIQTVGYPNPSPRDVQQYWRYLPLVDNGVKAALKVTCTHFQLPKGGPCLKLKDGETEKKFCGTHTSLSYLSQTADIEMTLEVALESGVKLDCQAEAVLLDEERREITTTRKPTTTTPPPVKLSYLTQKSEEVDSEEHGGAPGRRHTQCPCGWANKVRSRIVNGTVAAPNEFPFAVTLVDAYSKMQFCGGSIITAWHALTAAHCTVKRVKLGIPLVIVVGEHDMRDDPNSGASQVIEVDYVIEHHEYDATRYINDMSLLVLKREIVFSPKIGPVCLPTNQLDLTRQYVKIIGWGATVHMGPASNLLQKANVRVVGRKECSQVYAEVREKDPVHLCTYAGGKGSCQGDSGGPVVWLDPETNRYTLVGVVSFGRICADTSPSVHADVGAFLPWITHFVKGTRPSAKMCTKI